MAPEVLVCPDKKLPSDNKEQAGLLGYGAAVDAWCVCAGSPAKAERLGFRD